MPSWTGGYDRRGDGIVDKMDKKSRFKTAVSLRYRKEKDKAPVVTATGQGKLAEKIIAIAREHDIPVEQNPSLAQALGKLNPGQEIPPELYEAVAVLLAYIMEIDSKVDRKT